MTNKILAKRYAKALINLAKPNTIEKIRQDLQAILGIYSTNPELSKILEHPLISEDNKKKIILGLLKDKVEALLIRFMETLITKRRINLIISIVEIYNQLADESLGIVLAKVKTTFPISETLQESIRQKLAGITKKQVNIDIGVNPFLLGGLTIQIGDRIIDGSVQGKLRDLKEKLLERA